MGHIAPDKAAALKTALSLIREIPALSLSGLNSKIKDVFLRFSRV